MLFVIFSTVENWNPPSATLCVPRCDVNAVLRLVTRRLAGGSGDGKGLPAESFGQEQEGRFRVGAAREAPPRCKLRGAIGLPV